MPVVVASAGGTARRRGAIAGYLFLMPWVLGFIFFVGGPILAPGYLSFTAYDVARPPRWVGLENYLNAFTTDERFLGSLEVTFLYAIISVRLATVGSLLLALLLNQRLRGTTVFHTLFFSPILITLWTGIGGNRMRVFLAGLQGLSQQLKNAPDIDGAGAWARFRHVTLPLISPTMFFNLVLGIMGALKIFTVAFIATAGGPAYATWLIALHMWSQAFK